MPFGATKAARAASEMEMLVSCEDSSVIQNERTRILHCTRGFSHIGESGRGWVVGCFEPPRGRLVSQTTFGVWRNWWDYWGMTRHPAPHSTPLIRIFFWTFTVVYVLAALFAHYVGLRTRTYGAWPTTTYEPLSWIHSFEFALLISLIASIWIVIKWK